MKRKLLITAGGLLIVLSAFSTHALGQTKVSMNRERWVVHDWMRWPADAKKAEFVDHLGRPSLFVGSGLAYLRDLDFQDGTIEADIAAYPHGSFLGLAFRVQSLDDFELVYFRPFASGSADAMQYTPNLKGAIAWQIYSGPGATARAVIPYEKWLHVKIEVTGLRASIYLNHEDKAALVIPDLKQGDSRGSIGFWGIFGGGYISNVSYSASPLREARLQPKKTFAPGTLTQWEISDAFDAHEVDPATYPVAQDLKWQAVEAETPGMVVLNRYRRSPEIMPTPPRKQLLGRVPGSRVVFARTSIYAPRDEIRRLAIGYSDEVVVFLNRQPLFFGKNAWRFRDNGASLGLLQANDQIFLHLSKGKNELMLAVTEFMGGWGFQCNLKELDTAASAGSSSDLGSE